MLDPSIRAQYDISYVRSFVGEDISQKKEPITEKILVVFLLIWFFIFPSIFAIIQIVSVAIWFSIWAGVLAVFVIHTVATGKRDRFNLPLNASFIQELKLTDKSSKESHTGYLFVEGYDLLNRGTASAGSMAQWDDMPIKTRKQRNMEQAAVASAKDFKRKENAKSVSALIHNEEFQQKIANAVIRNEAFPDGMNFLYFEKYRPLKKKYKGRYYAVPGYRGAETKIVIPLDCGFGEDR